MHILALLKNSIEAGNLLRGLSMQKINTVEIRALVESSAQCSRVYRRKLLYWAGLIFSKGNEHVFNMDSSKIRRKYAEGSKHSVFKEA